MTIGDWIDTPTGGRITGYVFGFGASVVIIGALFKIMHWPGAGVILTAGMGTEALLFIVTALANPHKVYNWERVFPQIYDETADEAVTSNIIGGGTPATAIGGGSVSGIIGAGATGASGAAIAGGTSGTLSAVAASEINSMSETDLEKLKNGISKLSETAEQLNNLSQAGTTASQFAQNMANANNALTNYNAAQVQINNATNTLLSSYQGIAADMDAAKQNTTNMVGMIANVNKNLSSANSAYELQLQAITSANAEIEAFKQNTAKLNAQVNNLNSIYGNMLNALA